MVSVRSSQKSIQRKDVASSEGKRQRVRNIIIGNNSFTGPEPEKAKGAMFNLSAVESIGDQLPTIDEIAFIKRPISEHKSQRSGTFRKYELEDSLFNDSSRSVFNLQEDIDNKSYKTLASQNNDKKRSKLRCFNI